MEDIKRLANQLGLANKFESAQRNMPMPTVPIEQLNTLQLGLSETFEAVQRNLPSAPIEQFSFGCRCHTCDDCHEEIVSVLREEIGASPLVAYDDEFHSYDGVFAPSRHGTQAVAQRSPRPSPDRSLRSPRAEARSSTEQKNAPCSATSTPRAKANSSTRRSQREHSMQPSLELPWSEHTSALSDGPYTTPTTPNGSPHVSACTNPARRMEASVHLDACGPVHVRSQNVLACTHPARRMEVSMHLDVRAPVHVRSLRWDTAPLSNLAQKDSTGKTVTMVSQAKGKKASNYRVLRVLGGA